MALIPCPSCGKRFSDKSETCPKCGYQFFDQVQLVRKIPKMKIAIGILIVIVVGSGLIYKSKVDSLKEQAKQVELAKKEEQNRFEKIKQDELKRLAKERQIEQEKLEKKYTKTLASGESAEKNAKDWNCVLENKTGLLWEVKTDDDGLRDKDWTYSWYNNNKSNNGGSAGMADQSDNCFDKTRCDTEKYVADVNKQGLCGYNDWRMPTKDELAGLLTCSYSKCVGERPFIIKEYFPNTSDSYYWSSSPDFERVDSAWLILFSNAYVGTNYKQNNFNVRLVRKNN